MNKTELVEVLSTQLSLQELRELCAALALDANLLQGTDLHANAERLVATCEANGLLPRLEAEIGKRVSPATALTEKPPAKSGKLSFLRNIPKEVAAAIITGVFGLATVFAGAIVPRLLAEKPTPTATPTLQPTAEVVFTVTPPMVTQTPTLTAVPTSTLPTETPMLAPQTAEVQVFSQLSGAAKALVDEITKRMLELAGQFPLMIRDGFENNDYGWAVNARTDYDAVYCESKISDGSYHIMLETKTSGGWCSISAPRPAQDFLMQAEITAQQPASATIWIYFRHQDSENTFYLGIRPGAQQYVIGQYLEGQAHMLTAWTYSESIASAGTNTVSILAAQEKITLSINRTMLAILTDPAPAAGRFYFYLQEDAAGMPNELIIDNFELRGQ